MNTPLQNGIEYEIYSRKELELKITLEKLLLEKCKMHQKTSKSI